MEICTHSRFMILTYNTKRKEHQLSLLPAVADTITAWSAGTRISPLWPVQGYDCSNWNKYDFPGKQWIIFLGPIMPILIEEHFLQDKNFISGLWISIGSYNVIFMTRNLQFYEKCLKWISEKYTFESWRIKNGIILDVKISQPVILNNDWKIGLSELLKKRSDLFPVIEEYAALMASAISRAKSIHNSPFLQNLLDVNDYLTSWLSTEPHAELFPLLVNVNAALSRFTSQAFSGLSPIFETESHYWIHSLLGTGTANLAINNLIQFIHDHFGQMKIPAKFAALEKLHDNVLFLPDTSFHKISDINLLDNPNLNTNNEKLLPYITYFSGRDGFKYKDHTLSIPLGSITGCNSYEWSLLTTTHEISHSFFVGLFNSLLPDMEDQEMANNAIRLLHSSEPQSNWLDAIRQFFFKAIVALAASQSYSPLDKTKSYNVNENHFYALLEAYKYEVEEIMVHVFDFMYFYRQNPERYIKSIWVSWSVIPNIKSKTQNYVMRTLCAVLAAHIHKGSTANDDVKKIVIENLASIKSDNLSSNYINNAIQYINDNWTDVSRQLDARKAFVRIVNTFIYSKSIATSFMPAIPTCESRNAEFDNSMIQKQMTGSMIDNPLIFLEKFTKSETSSDIQSVWMLNLLAFNIQK